MMRGSRALRDKFDVIVVGGGPGEWGGMLSRFCHTDSYRIGIQSFVLPEAGVLYSRSKGFVFTLQLIIDNYSSI